jgi:hypothetical protein
MSTKKNGLAPRKNRPRACAIPVPSEAAISAAFRRTFAKKETPQIQSFQGSAGQIGLPGS